MTDDDLQTLHDVYWELAKGEDNPGDFKRLANERPAKLYPEFVATMREIRKHKKFSINELSTLFARTRRRPGKSQSGYRRNEE